MQQRSKAENVRIGRIFLLSFFSSKTRWLWIWVILYKVITDDPNKSSPYILPNLDPPPMLTIPPSRTAAHPSTEGTRKPKELRKDVVCASGVQSIHRLRSGRNPPFFAGSSGRRRMCCWVFCFTFIKNTLFSSFLLFFCFFFHSKNLLNKVLC